MRFAKAEQIPPDVSPYNFSRVSSDNAHAEALAKGCVVIVPKDNELFVDIDRSEDQDIFNKNILKVEETFGSLTWRTTPSPSGVDYHVHIVVTLPRDVAQVERILLQSVLGSDRVREALSWIRLVNADPIPTLFFEKAPAALPLFLEPLLLAENSAVPMDYLCSPWARLDGDYEQP